MDKIVIHGGHPLRGSVQISGAKNAALPLMCASLLTDEKLVLSNLPRLLDITTLSRILARNGVEQQKTDNGERGHTLSLRTPEVTSTTAPYDLVRTMRASVLVLGPLLARSGNARVSLPGGCAIGARPVDLHLQGLQHLGAEIELEKGYIVARAPKGLQGAEYVFPFVSVGATENLLMAAVLAKGTSRLVNAAREPEITDLARCLIKMGAKIDGLGSSTLTIEGVARLHGCTHQVVADRIETGSLMMAAAATGGDVTLSGTQTDHLGMVLEALEAAGVSITPLSDGIRVRGKDLTGVDITTEPYPGFPTDLQAQMMALLIRANGTSIITESIFENRFMHVPELQRMGADISIKGRNAIVRGVPKLTGAPVMATDLRASMSLVIAALAAEGETVINRVYHLDRGYDRLVRKLSACGAAVKRVKE